MTMTMRDGVELTEQFDMIRVSEDGKSFAFPVLKSMGRMTKK